MRVVYHDGGVRFPRVSLGAVIEGVNFQIDIDALIADMFSSGESGLYIDFSDENAVFQETSMAGSGTKAGIGDVIGTALDKSGNGNHWIAPDDAARPVYGQDGSKSFALLDGVDDMMTGAVSNFTVASTVMMAINPLLDESFTAIGSHKSGGNFEMIWAQASSTVADVLFRLGGRFRINGAEYVEGDLSRGEIHTAITNRDAIILAMGVDLSGWTGFGTTRSLSRAMNGRVYAGLAINRELTAQEISALEGFWANRLGIALP